MPMVMDCANFDQKRIRFTSMLILAFVTDHPVCYVGLETSNIII